MSAESRKNQRYAVDLDCSLSHDDGSMDASIKNLSLGGAFIQADNNLPFDSKVNVSFEIPGYENKIEVGGVVRWTDEFGFGVQFDGLRAKDVWALGRYLESIG